MKDYEIKFKTPGHDEVTLELSPKEFLDALECINLIRRGFKFKTTSQAGGVEWTVE